MASNQSSLPTDTASPETALLEALIPGYGLASRFFMSYLKIDLNAYLQILMGLGLLTACIQYIYPQVSEKFSETFVSTAEIRMEDEVFNYMMYWVSRQSHMKQTNRFLASVKIKSDRSWSDSDDSDSEEEDDDETWEQTSDNAISFDAYWAKLMNRDKYKTIKFTPSDGCHYFRYNGYLMRLRRTQEEKQRFSYYSNERFWLSCLGRNPEILKQLLLEAQKAYVERDGSRTVIYRAKRDYDKTFYWVRCMSRSPRPLSTVILDQSQKQEFVDDMREYLHPRTRRWYFNRGIPYRRGYLLHGPPGTGKTSLCFAAAGLLGLKLYLLNLKTNGMDEECMSSLFATLPRRCIVLLEDIDTAGVTQTRGKTVVPGDDPIKMDPEKETAPGADDISADSAKEGITLSGLLNVIDGVAASEGRILIMTTNHPDKLDPALLRPGRVDMSIGFRYTSEDDIKELFISMYKLMESDLPGTSNLISKKGTNQDISLDAQISNWCTSFVEAIPSGELTAAEIQGYLLNHKNSPDAAIAGASKWVEEMRKKRES